MLASRAAMSLVFGVVPLASCGTNAGTAASHGEVEQPQSDAAEPEVTPPTNVTNTADADTTLETPEMGSPDAVSGCATSVAQHPIEGANHVATCSPVHYETNPPSSGNHYAIWAQYKTYTQTFPHGFWVHSLEHGAVVITYKCPEGCRAEIDQAQALIDSLPADCGTSPKRRTIMLPDPDLDVRFAASAWGFTLKSSCFDRDAFAAFIAANYGHGPEQICQDGLDPLTANAGTPLCP